MSTLVADRNGSRNSKTGADFHILLKQLTTHPSQGRSTDLVVSSENLKDVEKGPPNGDGPFNLRNCLTSSNEANKAAGIQPKHVGVIWENLQVVVGGSIDHKVRTYFDGVGTDIFKISNRHTSGHLIVSSRACLWSPRNSLNNSLSLHASE
jgi:hypothetical protein